VRIESVSGKSVKNNEKHDKVEEETSVISYHDKRKRTLYDIKVKGSGYQTV
jgi:hypothetical protein